MNHHQSLIVDILYNKNKLLADYTQTPQDFFNRNTYYKLVFLYTLSSQADLSFLYPSSVVQEIINFIYPPTTPLCDDEVYTALKNLISLYKYLPTVEAKLIDIQNIHHLIHTYPSSLKQCHELIIKFITHHDDVLEYVAYQYPDLMNILLKTNPDIFKSYITN